MFLEELGYVEGGSNMLVHALTSVFTQWQGAVRLHPPASRVELGSERVASITTGGAAHPRFACDDTLSRAEGLDYPAQPLRPPGLATIPPVEASLRELQIADTCFSHPEFRSIYEGSSFDKMMAARAVR